MDFREFLIIVYNQNIYLITIITIAFFGLYLFLFRRQLWGIFDPLFYAAITMGGAAFCVFFLYSQNQINPKYVYSFFLTELFLIIGILLSYSIFSSKKIDLLSVGAYQIADEKFVNIFLYIISIFYITVQLISFSTIGVVLFQEEANHVSAFKGHALIRIFLQSSQSVFIIAFLYKYICYKLSFFDKFLFAFYFISIALGGAKSAVLQPVIYFFILNYYLYKRKVVKKIKVKKMWLIPLLIFPILVIMIRTKIGYQQAVVTFTERLLASGDVFVMGYNDSVIHSFSNNSFFEYIFYPGFGNILKNLGFPITSPPVLGGQIYEYYRGVNTAGPNARHNYVGLVFLGPYLSIFFSFFSGAIIGYVRGKYISKNRNFFNLLLYTITYYWIVSLITDVNMFMSFFVWAIIVFLLVYFLSNIAYNHVTIK